MNTALQLGALLSANPLSCFVIEYRKAKVVTAHLVKLGYKNDNVYMKADLFQ